MSKNERSGRNLSSKQRRGVRAILVMPTLGKAAAEAQVSEATLRRWLTQPAFKAALNEAQDAVLAAATSQLTEAMAGALAVLRHISLDKNSPSTARVSAARAILGHALRFNEQLALADRVATLEEILKEQKGA